MSFCEKKRSVHIRNTDPVKNLMLQKSLRLDSDSETETTDTLVQTCSIVQGPFVVREDVSENWRINGRLWEIIFIGVFFYDQRAN